MAYQPIENYGLTGDLHTVALVGMNGSIDWFCFPHFDSPSVFAAILDDEKGGRFRISPTQADPLYKRFYWPDTNALITRFLTPDGVGQVTDYMPVGLPDDDPRLSTAPPDLRTAPQCDVSRRPRPGRAQPRAREHPAEGIAS